MLNLSTGLENGLAATVPSKEWIAEKNESMNAQQLDPSKAAKANNSWSIIVAPNFLTPNRYWP